jgi:Flp pilus assembly pilin Flp
MAKWFRMMLSDTSGATIVEYAIVIALIAAVAVLAVSQLGHNNSTTLSRAASSL